MRTTGSMTVRDVRFLRRTGSMTVGWDEPDDKKSEKCESDSACRIRLESSNIGPIRDELNISTIRISYIEFSFRRIDFVVKYSKRIPKTL